MPTLPPELESQIFELAFRSNSRNLDLKTTFCLVAQRVQQCCRIDRIFYELVGIGDENRGRKFLSLIHSNVKPPGLFTLVKTLFLHYSVEGATARDILAVCDRIERLTCWIPSNEDQQELPLLIGRLPLHQLSIKISLFLKIPSSSICLSTITHIDLVLESHTPPQLSQLLAPLPRLTHLCLSIEVFPVSAEYVETACSSFPRLQVVILCCNSNILGWVEEDLRYSVEVDHRIVVLADPFGEIMDWELASDMWSGAEAIVEERKKSLSVGNE
ncbi:hypothetical protein DFH08DRAFT_838974 [Mycena albidolilacea]|uniref:Uncharacterized protein n=1 Tax=Mycena albidolilacea TaxID=1033008 RepID=A0AAD7F3T8_9AGAR|nr:hypothetical protein DFH08DRAFT_838974 [Mycena albidolilacea]